MKSFRQVGRAEVARIIEDYVNDPNQSASQIADKYGVNRNTICCLLKKYFYILPTEDTITLVLQSKINEPEREFDEDFKIYIHEKEEK